MMQRRRVVITGMGAITPLGNTFVQSWNNLLSYNNKTTNTNNNKDYGITSLEEALKHQNLTDSQFQQEMEFAMKLPSQVAAPVRNIPIPDNRTTRFIQLALIASEEAMKQSKLNHYLDPSSSSFSDTSSEEEIKKRGDRIGVSIGVSMPAYRENYQSHLTMESMGGSIRRVSPFYVPRAIANSPSGRVSLQYGLRGPNHAINTACATGSNAIGIAQRMIQFGDADVMLAGATESNIDPITMAGFCRLRALSTSFNTNPSSSSRPFSNDRDGFVLGEGCGILVLEELEHAQARGAPILAELIGYGHSADANHVTAPDPEGRGALRSIQMAMNHAGIQPSDVDYVNAHATSTPKGDEIETKVIQKAFLKQNQNQNQNDRNNSLLVTSTKSATGHLLGAAGAVESAFTVMSMVEGKIPPTWNLDKNNCLPSDFEHVMNEPKIIMDDDGDDDRKIQVAVNNNLGFGGNNATLIFSAFE